MEDEFEKIKKLVQEHLRLQDYPVYITLDTQLEMRLTNESRDACEWN